MTFWDKEKEIKEYFEKHGKNSRNDSLIIRAKKIEFKNCLKYNKYLYSVRLSRTLRLSISSKANVYPDSTYAAPLTSKEIIFIANLVKFLKSLGFKEGE